MLISSLYRITSLFVLSCTPFTAYAASAGLRFDTLNSTIRIIADGVVSSTGYLMFTLGVVAFLTGLTQFIWNIRNGADGKEATNGKQFMKWGLIGLFVMFSFWGIIIFAQNILQVKGSSTITPPVYHFKIQQ